MPVDKNKTPVKRKQSTGAKKPKRATKVKKPKKHKVPLKPCEFYCVKCKKRVMIKSGVVETSYVLPYRVARAVKTTHDECGVNLNRWIKDSEDLSTWSCMEPVDGE